jgi:hypothetical protein
MDIIAAYREVGSYRGAAELCGTTPKTVRRVIQRHEAGGQRPQRKPRARNYDRMVELVHSRVEATRGRVSDKRLLPAARTAGYPGSPRNFRRLVAAEERAWRAGHHRGPPPRRPRRPWRRSDRRPDMRARHAPAVDGSAASRCG